MTNLEIISRSLTNNHENVSFLLDKTTELQKVKENKILRLNTEALLGLSLTGYGNSIQLSEETTLSLFGVSSIPELYNIITTNNDTFITLKSLSPTDGSIRIGSDIMCPLSVSCCNSKAFSYGEGQCIVLTFQCADIAPNEYIFNLALVVQPEKITGSALEIIKHVSTQQYNSDIDTISQDISGKQDVISDLATIRSGAAAGATALQAVPEEYVTESELTVKGYLTEADLVYATEAEIDAIFA